MPERTPILTTVQDVGWLTPRMARIVLGGDALAGFGAGAFTDHYVKLLLPPGGRALHGAVRPGGDQGGAPARAVAADAHLHRPRLGRRAAPAHDRLRRPRRQPGSPARGRPTARPGDRLQLFGPGGAYAPDPDGRLAPDGRRRERAPRDRRLPRARARGRARHRARRGRRAGGRLDARRRPARSTCAGSDRGLLDALRALELPPGRGQCFVHGEATACARCAATCSSSAASTARLSRSRATGSARAPRRAGARTRRSGPARPSSTAPPRPPAP